MQIRHEARSERALTQLYRTSSRGGWHPADRFITLSHGPKYYMSLLRNNPVRL